MSFIKAKCSEYRNLKQTLRSACRAVVGICEGMRPFEITGNRWEDYVKLADKLTGCECVDWICVAKDAVQGKFVVKL